jgi:hypothetical protein
MKEQNLIWYAIFVLFQKQVECDSTNGFLVNSCLWEKIGGDKGVLK